MSGTQCRRSSHVSFHCVCWSVYRTLQVVGYFLTAHNQRMNYQVVRATYIMDAMYFHP